jgi:hypothetical protein
MTPFCLVSLLDSVTSQSSGRHSRTLLGACGLQEPCGENTLWVSRYPCNRAKYLLWLGGLCLFRWIGWWTREYGYCIDVYPGASRNDFRSTGIQEHFRAAHEPFWGSWRFPMGSWHFRSRFNLQPLYLGG